MAIVKVGTYRNPPEDITDYEAIVAHLEAYTRQIGNQGMILTEWTNTTTAPKIAMGSYISHGGVLYVVEDEDYALPALSVDGTYYIRVAVSGATLVITYTTNIADYSWNAVYGGLYHADESQVLPYQVVKNASAIEKYKMINPWQNNDFAVVNYLGRYYCRELHVTGAISGASVDTGFGANEVFKTSTQSIEAYATSSDVTSQLSPMDIGEVRYVYYSCRGVGYTANISTPAGGNFYISPARGSHGGSYAGNTNFISVFGDILYTGVFIIRRNS